MARTRIPLKHGLSSIAAALALIAAPAAQASLIDGIVDSWTVDVNAQFLTSTVVWSGSGGTQTISSTELTWGSGGQSGLKLTNENTSEIVATNGAAQNNLTLTHTNVPITGATLDKVSLESMLTLTPYDPSGTGLAPVALNFLINFQETPNGANPCADGGANGSGVNVNGCADIFVMSDNLINFEFFYDLDDGGPLQNQRYYISFFESTSGLVSLPTTACTAAGASAPCIGFRTPESAITPATFASIITTDPVVVTVPEPATLAMLGIGLLGLGTVRRRKPD